MTISELIAVLKQLERMMGKDADVLLEVEEYADIKVGAIRKNGNNTSITISQF